MATIGDLVVRLSANTKAFEGGIAKSQIALNHLTQTASKTVNAVSNFNSLRIGPGLENGLIDTADSMNDLQEATLEIDKNLRTLEQAFDLTASGASLLSGSIKLATGTSGVMVASTAALSKGLTSALIGAVALRQTTTTLAYAFGLAADGAKVLLMPLRMIGSAFMMVGSLAVKMAKLILGPFRLVFSALKLAASAAWALISPFMGLAGGAVRLYVTFKAFQLQLKILSKLFSFLPPKVKVIFVALMGLGAASRVAGAALASLGIVGRVAAKAISILTLPIRALINPVGTAVAAVKVLNNTLEKTAQVSVKAASAVGSGFIGGIKSMGRSVVNTGKSIIGFGASALPFAAMGAVKLAADAETLGIKLKVLTGSADTANRVMSQMDAFAADTPFQKMEIGDAVQKLISFGSASETVFDELRMIGDIAAATGTPIGELSELYGKAQVQGRLFGEDINQLTGRGIPIVAELAKQFGVAESQVKELVADGKIGFPEMQKAMAAMVGPAGKFGGMMSELSATTSGKFSTFVDRVLLLGTAIGEQLLPHANRLLDWASGMVASVDGVGTAFSTATSFAMKWFTDTQNFLIDIGTIAGVVVGNFDNIWRGVFESMIEYARAAFSWIKDNSEIMYKNLKASADKAMGLAQNVAMAPMDILMNPFQAGNIAAGLGEDAVGLGNNLTKGTSEFKMPENKRLAGVLDDINEALRINAANRSAAAMASEAQRTDITKPSPLNTSFIKSGSTADATGASGNKGNELAGATKAGSQEAYSLLAQAFVRSKDPAVKATQEQTKQLMKPLAQMAAATVGGLGGFGGMMLVESI
jgi:tape measure domain-containing protein